MIPAEARSLVRLRQSLEEWLRGSDTPASELHNIVAACNEACANAAEHAYRAGESGSVEVIGERDGDEVRIRVRDDGSWRPAAAAATRGRGLKVMRAFMDEVDVDRSEEGTTVTLVRRVRRTEAA